MYRSRLVEDGGFESGNLREGEGLGQRLKMEIRLTSQIERQTLVAISPNRPRGIDTDPLQIYRVGTLHLNNFFSHSSHMNL